MGALEEAIIAKSDELGYGIASVNECLARIFLDNGATGGTLNDMWFQFAAAEGVDVSGKTLNEVQMILAAEFQGTLTERLIQYFLDLTFGIKLFLTEGHRDSEDVIIGIRGKDLSADDVISFSGTGITVNYKVAVSFGLVISVDITSGAAIGVRILTLTRDLDSSVETAEYEILSPITSNFAHPTTDDRGVRYLVSAIPLWVTQVNGGSFGAGTELDVGGVFGVSANECMIISSHLVNVPADHVILSATLKYRTNNAVSASDYRITAQKKVPADTWNTSTPEAWTVTTAGVNKSTPAAGVVNHEDDVTAIIQELIDDEGLVWTGNLRVNFRFRRQTASSDVTFIINSAEPRITLEVVHRPMDSVEAEGISTALNVITCSWRDADYDSIAGRALLVRNQGTQNAKKRSVVNTLDPLVEPQFPRQLSKVVPGAWSFLHGFSELSPAPFSTRSLFFGQGVTYKFLAGGVFIVDGDGWDFLPEDKSYAIMFAAQIDGPTNTHGFIVDTFLTSGYDLSVGYQDLSFGGADKITGYVGLEPVDGGEVVLQDPLVLSTGDRLTGAVVWDHSTEVFKLWYRVNSASPEIETVSAAGVADNALDGMGDPTSPSRGMAGYAFFGRCPYFWNSFVEFTSGVPSDFDDAMLWHSNNWPNNVKRWYPPWG